ncbi:MAG: S1 RNA-binding domain-containing protein [Patescibacteria group bacterium]|nr:S1 RNA-binding domain-containing protein [Patescibacteria group bacterium]
MDKEQMPGVPDAAGNLGAASGNEPVDFKQLVTNVELIKVPKVGDLIKGKVIAVSNSEVRLDIDGLTTGVVRGREFFDESDQYRGIAVGDEVEATVTELENENGEMELSFRFAGHQRAWGNLAQLQHDGAPIEVVIAEANKGGLMARVGGILGFLPVSQLSPEHYPRVPGGDKAKIFERLRELAGQRLTVKVFDVNEEEGKLILSEKAAWEEKQKDVISRYRVGDTVTGKVTAVTTFGVFLEFGEHLEGLIHISELAWQRIEHPSDLFTIGQEMSAKIINIQGSKIFLSAKQLVEDPWKDISVRYQIGQKVTGKVLKVNPFGLFVELDAQIHGLAHISELSDAPVADVTKVAKPGDVLEFKIISIEPKNHRLGLSRKRLDEPEPKVEEKAEASDAPAKPSAEASTPSPENS